MSNSNSGTFGLSSIAVTAALSLVVLLAAAWWRFTPKPPTPPIAQSDSAQSSTSTSTAEENTAAMLALAGTSTTPLGDAIAAELVKSYASLTNSGTYSTSTGVAAARDIAKSISARIQYRIYIASDFKTTTDTSKVRASIYRNDMQKALQPLFDNKTMELELFAQYVDTHDAAYLTQLSAAAQNYRSAIANLETVVVPIDATEYHLGIANALGEFAGVLDILVQNARDPFASALVLKSYTTAEGDLLTAFQAYAGYAKRKNI